MAVLFGMGLAEFGYLTAAVYFGLTKGQTAAAILGISLVAGAVKTARERRRQRSRCEAMEKAIQLWEANMARQEYELPESEWKRLRPFYVVAIQAMKNERDRAGRRGGRKKEPDGGGE